MPDTVSEVRTRQVAEDDVPSEYFNRDWSMYSSNTASQ